MVERLDFYGYFLLVSFKAKMDSWASLLRIGESLSPVSVDSAVVAERDFKAEKYASASRINSPECMEADQVLWAGFGKLECEGGVLRQLLLLGYKSGFYVWDVEDADDVPTFSTGSSTFRDV